jgi:hypothetical protein
MLLPFDVSTDADVLLSNRYPRPLEFAEACKLLPAGGKLKVLRAFVSEGVPAAFERYPTLYETVREYVSSCLNIDAKNTTVVGSARPGYSLAPPPSYGAPFNPDSDLDLAGISEGLFNDLASAFSKWKSETETGNETPHNARESRFWNENLKLIPRNISRGFVDSYKIPNRYEPAMRVSQTLWKLREKLNRTPVGPKVKSVSLRVYRDWIAFLNQQVLNLRLTLGQLP